MDQDNTRFAAVDGGTGGDGAGRHDNGDAAWNRRHPDCGVCSTACCLNRGELGRCACHKCEAGVVRSGTAVHVGQCLVIFIKARAVETVASLLNDVAAGVRVLRDRDHLPITEEQVLDRARNIVTGIVGNYDVVLLERTTAVGTQIDWNAKEIG